MDEQEEQRAVLPLPLDPGELPRAGVEGAGEVALLVLPRRRDRLLLAHQHPVRPDLGVQVDVDLVLVNGDLIRAEVADQPPESTPAAAAGGPSARGSRRSAWGGRAAPRAASGAGSP